MFKKSPACVCRVRGSAVGLTSILHRGQFLPRDAVLAQFMPWPRICVRVRHKSKFYQNS